MYLNIRLLSFLSRPIVCSFKLKFCLKKKKRKLGLNFRVFLYPRACQVSAPLGQLAVAGNVFGHRNSIVSAVRLVPAWLLEGSGS